MIKMPDEFFDNLYKSVPKNYFENKKPKEIAKNQELVRDTLRQCLKIDQIPMKTNRLHARILEEDVDCGAYVRRRVAFEICEGLDCPIYILLPKGEPRFPTVLALSGHGFGCRDILGMHMDGSKRAASEQSYQKDFALALVQHGMVVVVPELIGFGDMRLKRDQRSDFLGSSCFMMSTRLLMYGLNMAGLRVYQCMRVLDYMQHMNEVDPQRMGCMGISGGGLVSCFLSALDLRIKASVVSGYLNTYHDSIMDINHCIDNFPQDLLAAGEMYDVASLIAPRPLLIEAGTQDPIFPMEATKQAYQYVRHVYSTLGAEERIDADFFDGDHQISGKKAYDFLEKWLR